jgi:hypothetical protein
MARGGEGGEGGARVKRGRRTPGGVVEIMGGLREKGQQRKSKVGVRDERWKEKQMMRCVAVTI